MKNIFEFIPNLKLIYLVLIILVMIMINIVLNKKQISNNYKYLINGIILVIFGLMINYSKDIVESIFNLDYLSIKLYIIILIIVNVIMILTIQKKFSQVYKIINYLLFGLSSLILIANLIIIIGTKTNLITTNLNNYIIKLINTSIVIFIIYLTIISAIYIAKNLFFKNNIEENKQETNYKEIILTKINILKEKRKDQIKKNNIKEEINLTELNEKVEVLSLEDLLKIEDKSLFSINGVNCSIIFEDSVPENIYKNYQLLRSDINNKLVNGYTLDENIMLKNICNKLQTTNLYNLDFNDVSILNKLSPEEYKFLKQICNK